ncbi:MAG: hypothetical protein ACRDSE_22200, partial [Pseudonocardiaceae bacterium]
SDRDEARCARAHSISAPKRRWRAHPAPIASTGTRRREAELEPGYPCTTEISVRVVDDQSIHSWAISHRPLGGYVFFDTAVHDPPGLSA